jgi:hypothetical protein
MSDVNEHLPTPEFRASLEREIARAFRSETQFGRSQRTRRLGMVIGLAAGAVMMLTVGMILGVRTGYASAESLDARHRDDGEVSTLDILRTVPVRNALAALTCGSVAVGPRVAPIQKGIPLIDLPPATTKAAETFGAIVGIRQGSDGKVLVNDVGRHQLTLFDTTLTGASIVFDSVAGTANSYGPVGAPLMPFVGDSSLFVDWNAQTLIVLDGHGRVARGLALPALRDFRSVTNAGTGVDAKGRLVFRAIRAPQRVDRTAADAFRESLRDAAMEYGDSIAIVRADLDARRVDTIGRFARPLMKITTEKYSDGSSGQVYAIDPLQPVDEWAVLSNGAVAIVRGHDYHIDWIRADGSVTSTPKLPVELKHFSDEDKQRRADSVRAGQNALLAIGYPVAEYRLRSPMPCDGGGRGAGGGGRGDRSGRGGNADAPPPPPADMTCTQILAGSGPGRGVNPNRPSIPPLADLVRAGPIADYDSPLAAGGTIADADGNLWILPKATKLAQHGELVYDVVNAKGELFERVRLPAGRAIAGFGRGGVVYLTSGDYSTGYTLERTTLGAARK